MAQGKWQKYETVLLLHYRPGGAAERRVSARRVSVKEDVVARRVVASRSSETSQHTKALLQSSVNPALTNPLGILQLLRVPFRAEGAQRSGSGTAFSF